MSADHYYRLAAKRIRQALRSLLEADLDGAKVSFFFARQELRTAWERWNKR